MQTLYRICKNWKWFHFIFYFVRFNLLQISKLPNRIGNLMLFAAEDLLKNGFKSDILWILNELCVSSSSLLCFSPTSSMKVDADTNKILNSLKNVKICHIQSNIHRLYITRKKKWFWMRHGLSPFIFYLQSKTNHLCLTTKERLEGAGSWCFFPFQRKINSFLKRKPSFVYP